MSEWNKVKQDLDLLSESNSESSLQGKKQKIAYHFKKIMEALDLDLSDTSLIDTPIRVAKMYVDELFSGLNDQNKPAISKFENSYNYSGIILEKNIQLYSVCVVSYLAKRPQVQEKLTVQIVEFLKDVLETQDVACVIEAQHLCVSMRGIKDESSMTTTAEYSGKFLDVSVKNEFLTLLSSK